MSISTALHGCKRVKAKVQSFFFKISWFSIAWNNSNLYGQYESHPMGFLCLALQDGIFFGHWYPITNYIPQCSMLWNIHQHEPILGRHAIHGAYQVYIYIYRYR